MPLRHAGTHLSANLQSAPPRPLCPEHVCVGCGTDSFAALRMLRQPYYFEALAGNFSALPEHWRLHAHDPGCEPTPMAEQLANGSAAGPFTSRLVVILYGDR